jgi:hypothetical protein
MLYAANDANFVRRSENLLEYEAFEAISIILGNISSTYFI